MSEPNWTPHFRPGERLLWEGAPLSGFHRPGAYLFLMSFGLLFLVIGIAVVVYGLLNFHAAPTASDTGLAVFVIAFGLPFGAIGAFLFFGPLYEAVLEPRRVRYALTSRAAYVFRSTMSRKLEVYPIPPTSWLQLEKGKRANTVWFHAWLENGPDGASMAHVGFRNIAEGERVFHLIRDLQEKDDA